MPQLLALVFEALQTVFALGELVRELLDFGFHFDLSPLATLHFHARLAQLTGRLCQLFVQLRFFELGGVQLGAELLPLLQQLRLALSGKGEASFGLSQLLPSLKQLVFFPLHRLLRSQVAVFETAHQRLQFLVCFLLDLQLVLYRRKLLLLFRICLF